MKKFLTLSTRSDMRKVILIFIVWVGCLNTLSAQWLNVFYPDLRRVTFPTATTGYAIGSGGELLKTTDSGVNWVVYPTPFLYTNGLHSIYFQSETIGFIAGRKNNGGAVIAKTIDGGLSWNTVLSANVAQSATLTTIQEIIMTSSNVGYAFPGGSSLLVTVDGGNSWIEKNQAFPSNFPSSIVRASFISDQIGFVVGTFGSITPNSSIIRTVDGGLTWNKVDFTSQVLKSIYAIDANNVYACGTASGQGIILRSTNGGATFTAQVTDQTDLFDIQFTDANTGFVLGREGINKTTNGGTSWGAVNSLSIASSGDLFMVDGITGFAAKAGGVIEKTTNGWTTAIDVYAKPTGELKSVFFPDAQTGYVVGRNSSYLKTINGAQTWSVSNILNTHALNSTYFTSTLIGYAVGDNGTILKTTDGGTTWNPQTSTTTDRLNGVTFVDQNTGIAVGSSGRILKTTNGGTSWVQKTSGSSNQLNGVSTSGSVVIAVGTSGTILKSTDSGETWSSKSSGQTVSLNTVQILTSNLAYIGGEGGKVLKSVDIGESWSSQFTNSTAEVNSIYFTDENSGFGACRENFAGDVAMIIKTNDGGGAWQKTQFSLPSKFNGIFSPSALTTVTVGTSGRLFISVCSNPSISNQPGSQTITAGQTLNLAVTATGTGTITYQWKRDGVNVGTNSNLLTLSNIGAGDAGNYTVTVSDACGSATSSAAVIKVLSEEAGAQPTAFTLTSATSTSVSFSFAAATGAPDGYIILRRANNAVVDAPTDGVAYTNETTIGTSTVVQSSAALTATDNGLTQGNIYHYSIFAYKGSGAAINYLTTSPLQGTSVAAAPTVQPTQFLLTAATATSASFSFTTASGADGYVVVRKSGSSPTDVPLNTNSYTAGAALGTSTVAYMGTVTTFTDTGLATGSIYFYSVYSFRGAGLSTSYLTTAPLQGNALASEPANHITNLNFDSFTATGFNVSFSAALGTPAGYLVVRKKDTAPTAIPADGTVYTVGATVGDAVVTSVGTSTSFDQTGLEPGSRYFFQVFTYNGIGVSTNYLTTSSTNNVGIGITKPAAPNAIAAINILFDTFTARWDPVGGGDKYQLDVSELSDFSTRVSGYDGKETTTLIETVTGLKINTNYFYRVRAVNTSGASTNSNTITLKTNDVPTGTTSLQSTVPAFATTFPSDEQQQKVSITLSGGLGARTVSLFHRPISGNSFAEIAATTTNQNLFEATITRQMLDDLGVEFYLVSNDAAFTVTSNRFTVRKSFSGSTSPTVPITLSGGTLESYQIISIPLALEDNLIQTIFGSVLGEYDPTQWRIVRFQDGGNVDYPTINRIELGKSYWFNSREAVSIKSGVGSAVDASETQPAKLTLDIGWNQIATPFPFAIDWDDVLAANGSPADVGPYKVYVPSEVSFAESNTLQPFSGGFVFSERAIPLNLPVTLKNTAGARKAQPTRTTSDISTTAWAVPFLLTQGKSNNPMGAIGMSPAASASKDALDDITLPRFIKYLELNSYHPEFSLAPRFSKDFVPTADQHRWNISIESNFEEGDLTLSWEGIDLGNNQAQLLLYDPTLGTLLDMKKVGHYTFPKTQRHDLELLYSRENLLDLEGNFELGKPFPNPSTKEVSFHVFSWEPSRIQLEIYDLNGRKVFAENSELAGKQVKTLQWDSHHNGKAPAGVYLYKIISTSSGKTNLTQGRILIH
jgi:photosystem II stability/assembly factor-like uncharacterized protein